MSGRHNTVGPGSDTSVVDVDDGAVVDGTSRGEVANTAAIEQVALPTGAALRDEATLAGVRLPTIVNEPAVPS